ncbi:MAG TPA: hypothetical protein VEL07_02960 [Planctomycetota bacterium]|nr:hypothetical protein [Planctomycetota bacterium]
MIARGLTLVEVMIALVVLVVAIGAMLSTIVGLDQAHRAAKETATAQRIAQVMVERFQGASWHSLGQTAQPWSWHRRDDAAALNPPLTDAGDPASSLQALGILDGPSGLAGLRVHVEYYAMELFQNGDAAWMVADGRQFRTRLADASLRLEQDHAVINLREQSDAIVVRIVLRWDDNVGGTRRHELTFARRR